MSSASSGETGAGAFFPLRALPENPAMAKENLWLAGPGHFLCECFCRFRF
jgi:hypothetical protein